MNRFKISALISLLTLAIAGASYATGAWMKTFNNLYHPQAGSALKTAKCAVCHLKPNAKGGLNAYGKSLEDKDISADSLKSVESDDADKNGVDNITEIKAGKLPGNSKSKP
ncbi:MAG: hypothetical protein NT018_09070 [Armatimonadetes bacterium]|nr:hypothetical protein [Armatimonadota bacterium]